MQSCIRKNKIKRIIIIRQASCVALGQKRSHFFFRIIDCILRDIQASHFNSGNSLCEFVEHVTFAAANIQNSVSRL